LDGGAEDGNPGTSIPRTRYKAVRQLTTAMIGRETGTSTSRSSRSAQYFLVRAELCARNRHGCFAGRQTLPRQHISHCLRGTRTEAKGADIGIDVGQRAQFVWVPECDNYQTFADFFRQTVQYLQLARLVEIHARQRIVFRHSNNPLIWTEG